MFMVLVSLLNMAWLVSGPLYRVVRPSIGGGKPRGQCVEGARSTAKQRPTEKLRPSSDNEML